MAETSQPKVRHPLFARIYPRVSQQGEARGADEHRRQMLAGASGRAIEVGAGHGANFPYYRESVTELVAVEPEPHLRELAEERAVEASVPVRVVDGVADALPGEDGSFDFAVASLVLCSVPDQSDALAEIRRVLRPGGELRFYEHVISHRRVPAALQRAADATFWPHVAGGCHMSRDTLPAIERAGFTIEGSERFSFSPSLTVPSTPHVIGLARRT